MSNPLLNLREGPVARLRLNRPELHNAFDAVMIAALTGALEAVARDDGVRVVVLEGEGASFSAGADLNWMRAMASASEAENRDDALALARLMRSLNELPKPTIAKVHGAAYGGGVGLVACCDIAIASLKARFSMSEVKLGLVPGTVSPYVIAAMGERQARRYMLTGERIDAAEALRIGLVHKVVDAGALEAAVEELVKTLLANGPQAMSEAKELIATVARRPLDDRLVDDTAARFARIRTSDEGREGVKAFLEKRNPAWTKK